jgi:hypothetical protein
LLPGPPAGVDTRPVRAARVVALLPLLVASSADARPPDSLRHRSYFLAGDPHVPLAVVTGDRIEDRTFSSHHCGSRRRWKALGSRWRALDTWGQPLGVFTVSSKDEYDVTGCAELSFSPKLNNDLAHLFVSADSFWRPSAPVEWNAPAGRRAALAALARSEGSPPARAVVFPHCASVPQETLFFHVPRRGDWAVTTGSGGWLVARDDPRGWVVASSARSIDGVCFRPVAVFDMNADGVPEIVLRMSGGDGWNDFVLRLDGADQWSAVAASPGGATA